MIKKLFNKFFSTTTPDVMSFQQSFDLTDLPIVTLKQGDRKFNFILDTGSADNVIDKRVLDITEHSVCENVKIPLSGLNGKIENADVYEITFSYKDKCFPFTYLAGDTTAAFDSLKKSKGVTVHGLLGSKFFNHYNYIVDFNELIAYNKKA